MKEAVCIAALLVALAACSAAQGRDRPLTRVQAKTYTMDQKNNQFVPQKLVVPREATVVFKNDDADEHNVTLAIPENDKTLNKNLGTFPPGEKTSYTFETPGVVRVHCNLHPEMTATIVVR